MTPYFGAEYTAVATLDGDRAAQVASLGYYAIHQYKNFANVPPGHNECLLVWVGQSSTHGMVQLQIYNRTTALWETVAYGPGVYADSGKTYGSGVSYYGPVVNNDFRLSASIPDLTNYTDASGFVSCRVLQLQE